MSILQEALQDFNSHTVRDGVIRDPGRMEGETLLTVYLDHLEGNGCGGECLSYMEEGCGKYVSILDVDSDMRSELAQAGYELNLDTIAILYTVSESGFVSSEELTEKQRDKIIAAYEEEEDSEA